MLDNGLVDRLHNLIPLTMLIGKLPTVWVSEDEKGKLSSFWVHLASKGAGSCVQMLGRLQARSVRVACAAGSEDRVQEQFDGWWVLVVTFWSSTCKLEYRMPEGLHSCILGEGGLGMVLTMAEHVLLIYASMSASCLTDPVRLSILLTIGTMIVEKGTGSDKQATLMKERQECYHWVQPVDKCAGIENDNDVIDG